MDARRLAGSLDVEGKPTALGLTVEGALLVGLDDGRVREIAPAARRLLADPFGPGGRAAVAVGGGPRWRLVVDVSGRIRRLDDRGLSDAVVSRVEARPPEVRVAAISPVGDRLALVSARAGAYDHTIAIWDAESMQRLFALSPNVGPHDDCLLCHTLAFSPDGRWLAAYGADVRYDSEGGRNGVVKGRFTLARAHDGEVWLAQEVGEAWTIAELERRPIAFLGERVIFVGECRVERPDVKVGYRDEPEAAEWWPMVDQLSPDVLAVDERGLVVKVERERAWQIQLAPEPEVVAEAVLPGRAVGVVIAGDEAWFAVESGALVAWALER